MESKKISKDYISNVAKQVEEVKSEINSFFLKNGNDDDAMNKYRSEFKERVTNLMSDTWKDFPTANLDANDITPTFIEYENLINSIFIGTYGLGSDL